MTRPVLHIPTPGAIVHQQTVHRAQLNPIQSALVQFCISQDPRVASIATKILTHAINMVDLALILKATCYLTGMSISVISTFSFTALLASEVALRLIALCFYFLRVRLCRWLEYRDTNHGPLNDPTAMAKHIVQSNLQALHSSLTHVPKWKQLIRSGQSEDIRNLFTDPTYASTWVYTDEQYTALGDEFKTACEQFREGVIEACNKSYRLTDKQFDELVMERGEALKKAVDKRIEFSLFPNDLINLGAYKRSLIAYLRSEIPDFPETEEPTKKELLRLLGRFHPDTASAEKADPELMNLLKEAATLTQCCSQIDEQRTREGNPTITWISGLRYQELRKARRVIENALYVSTDFKRPQGMQLPLPLFSVEARQYIATISANRS